MNSQYFSKKDVETGVMATFIGCLLDACYSSDGFYNDIHIIPEDLGGFRVEWLQVSWEHRYEYPQFEVVKPDETVMHELLLPDNSFEYSASKEEDEEILTRWQEENPGWTLGSFGWEYKTTNTEDVML